MLSIRYNGTDSEHTLVCEGHAGNVESGKNIICAAASIIIITLAEVIEEEIASNDYGYSEISCARSEKNDAAFEFALCGLGLLAEHHPEEVHIEK